MLLLTALTIKDALHTRFDGILGDLECSVWNGEMFLWGGLVASTWNLVCLTVERYTEHCVNFIKPGYLSVESDIN